MMDAMERIGLWLRRQAATMMLAAGALRMWRVRQIVAALIGSVAFGVVLGVATVLIPNTLFQRDIPPVWWNYPVWIVTSIMTGLLIATYVRPTGSSTVSDAAAAESAAAARLERQERRGGRFAIAGGMLAWFAVGCPVCNKIALIALGYTGALTWFAPVQPYLAVTALVFTILALIWRLKGQVACPIPSTRDRPGSFVGPLTQF